MEHAPTNILKAVADKLWLVFLLIMPFSSTVSVLNPKMPFLL